MEGARRKISGRPIPQQDAPEQQRAPTECNPPVTEGSDVIDAAPLQGDRYVGLEWYARTNLRFKCLADVHRALRKDVLRAMDVARASQRLFSSRWWTVALISQRHPLRSFLTHHPPCGPLCRHDGGLHW